MKLMFRIICIAILLMSVGFAAAAETATVHGIAYEWSTFEPLDNAIIEVNSTPVQSMVAKYGIYSFELPNGSYLITATYYQEDVLTHYGEETLTVSEEGNYVLDLLLLPSYSSSEEMYMGSASDVSAESGQETAPSSNSLLAGTSLVVIILLAVLVYQFHQKNGGYGEKVKVIHKEPQTSSKPVGMQTEVSVPVTTPATSVTLPEAYVPVQEVPVHEGEKSEPKAAATTVHVTESAAGPANEPDTKPEVRDVPEIVDDEVSSPKKPDIPSGPIPSDLQEILDILRTQGGRMTQKDMRKRLKYSEGKVSLMLLDLEKRGKIQKFKKGRGNVLFLVDEDGA